MYKYYIKSLMGKGGAQPWNKSQWLNLIVDVFKWPQALRRLVSLAILASH